MKSDEQHSQDLAAVDRLTQHVLDTPPQSHHSDCDGWQWAHVGITRPSEYSGQMWRASCLTCSWTGGLQGASGQRDAQREADRHTELVECDGRCVEWEG